MKAVTRRQANATGFAICVLLTAYALFQQHYVGLEPCPLCVFQRLGVIALGVVFLLGAVHNPGRTGARVYGLSGVVVAGLGAAVAARHVWLQSLPPDRIPDCGPSLDYMLEVFPLTEALQMVFRGSGECAEIDWVFLGLSMPAWVLIALTGLGLASLVSNWALRR